MATVQITAPTPMMMPSMVKIVRILLRARARSATRMISLRSMGLLLLTLLLEPAAPAESTTRLSGLDRRLRRGDEFIAFLHVTLHNLRIRVIRDSGLDSHRNKGIVGRRNLPYGLPTAEVRCGGLSRNVVFLKQGLLLIARNCRLEGESRVRHTQGVAGIAGGNRYVGRLSGKKLFLRVAEIDDGVIGHHVLHRRRIQSDRNDAPGELIVWKGIDLERDVSSDMDTASIRFIRRSVDEHARQVLSDGEKVRCRERGCDRLPGIDASRNHSPADRSDNRGVFQIRQGKIEGSLAASYLRFRLFELCFALRDLRLCGLDGSLGLTERRLRQIVSVRRDDPGREQIL